MKISPKLIKLVEHYVAAFASTASGIYLAGNHHLIGVAKAAGTAVFGPVIAAAIAKAKKFAAVYSVGKATIKAQTPAK